MSSAKKKRAKARPTNGLGMKEVIEGLREGLETVRQLSSDETERTRIREEARVEVARIEAYREVMMDYCEKVFDERRKTFAQLFATVDKGIQADNLQIVEKALGSVIKLAESSPFEALPSIAATKKKLEQKNTWEL